MKPRTEGPQSEHAPRRSWASWCARSGWGFGEPPPKGLALQRPLFGGVLTYRWSSGAACPRRPQRGLTGMPQGVPEPPTAAGCVAGIQGGKALLWADP